VQLNNFLNLAREVVNYKELAALSGHKDERWLFSRLSFSNQRVVKRLTSRGVVHTHQLTRHEVIFDFEESDVLFTTTYQRISKAFAKFERGKLEVSQLSSEEFHFLILDRILESVHQN